jgi:uncharacterized protein YeaO (DUF488 family)
MKRTLKLHTYQIGEAPKRGEGLRIGVVRFLPMYVSRKDWPDYFDVWFPILAPSVALLRRARRSKDMDHRAFCASYERELFGRAESRQAVELLAALALRTPINIGCYCEDESQCHRSHLRKLVERSARKL